MDKTANALPQGHKIGAYEIVEELGSGGFGITYKAYDHTLQTHVAIKEYLPANCAIREADTISVGPRSRIVRQDYQYGLEMFLREARTLAQFRHERIIRVIQFLEANNTAYLVMEYERGASLANKVLDQSYPTFDNRVVALLMQLLQGLGEIHRANILHRDIKPSNIYIRQDDSPVLLDFGSARFALSGKTMNLTSMVSPGYAPFEQYVSNGRQGPWTDFYGLGATLYWVVTGYKPVDATDRFEAVVNNQSDPNVPATVSAGGKFSNSLLECIDWMLEPKAQNRPKTADNIIERLQTTNSADDITVAIPNSKFISSKIYELSRLSEKKIGVFALVVIVAIIAIAALLYGQASDSNSKKDGLLAKNQANRRLNSDLPLEQKGRDGSSVFHQLPGKNFEGNQPFSASKRASLFNEHLKVGDLALSDYRLTTPAEDSAVFHYRQALKIYPGNQEAVSGLSRVVAAYISLAEQKWMRGDTSTANTYLDRASTVTPGHPDIAKARSRVAGTPPKLTSRYPNVRAAKLAYRRREISKAQYGWIKESLGRRYKRQINYLKRLYRSKKLTKRQYKLRVRRAEKEYKG